MDQWTRLVQALGDWAEAARVVAPGRIEVRFLGRTATIMMTPGEWDDMWSVPYGDVDTAIQVVRANLLELAPDDPYLVYETYDLVASATPELPPDAEGLRIEEWRRQNPDPAGSWYAYPPGDRDEM